MGIDEVTFNKTSTPTVYGLDFSGRLNFGKYVGKKIDGLPDHYLRWMVEFLTDNPWLGLRKLAFQELGKRGYFGELETSQSLEEPLVVFDESQEPPPFRMTSFPEDNLESAVIEELTTGELDLLSKSPEFLLLFIKREEREAGFCTWSLDYLTIFIVQAKESMDELIFEKDGILFEFKRGYLESCHRKS